MGKKTEIEEEVIDWRQSFDVRCDWSAAPTWEEILQEIKDVIRRYEGGEK